MAFDLFIEPATFDLPNVKPLQAFRWGHLPQQVAYSVAAEEQYLKFHLLLLERLRFTAAGGVATKLWSKPIDFTVRAGSIKSAVLLSASIAEAVLRALAEARAYELPRNPNHRTMGKILGAWQNADKTPKAELMPVWPVLQELHSIRNNIHLFKAAADPDAAYDAVLARESDLVPQLLPTIDALSAIKP